MEIPIKHRRGSATEWTTANPILRTGQFGIEMNTRKIKIGDGVTAWNSLLYIAGSDASAAWADLEDIPAAVTALSGTNTGDETQGTILTKLGDGAHIGAEFLPDALSGLPPIPYNVVTGTTPALPFAGALFPVSSGFPFPDGWLSPVTHASPGATTFAQADTAYYLAGPAGSNLVIYDSLGDISYIAEWAAADGLGSAPDLIGIGSGLPNKQEVDAPTPSHIGQLYRDTTNDVWYRATSISPPMWELDKPVSVASLESIPAADMQAYLASLGVSIMTAPAIVSALGLLSYANLAAANAAQPVGTLFLNTTANQLQITTA